MKPIEKFVNLIEVDDNECWVWQGSRNPKGYGWFQMIPAHRWSWRYFKGDLPDWEDRMVLDHLCNNKACVCPDHLEPVTNAENKLRAQQRAETCKRGHLWSEHGYWYFASNYGKQVRQCRECYRIRRKSYGL